MEVIPRQSAEIDAVERAFEFADRCRNLNYIKNSTDFFKYVDDYLSYNLEKIQRHQDYGFIKK